MNDLFSNIKTDILRFDRDKGKRIYLKDCELLTNFLFSKNDFYLLYKDGYYYICLSYKDDFILLWVKKEYENGEKTNSGEVISLFRKKYLANNITQERLGLFLDSPLEYEKKYPKSLNR